MTAAPKLQEPEGPAVVTADHVQDRTLRIAAGSGLGWRKLTPFEKAHAKGQLVDRWKCPKGDDVALKRETGIAVNRFEAGNRFAMAWKMAETSIPGSSDLNRVRSVGTPGSFVDHAIDAKKFLRAVEASLSPRDYLIIRRICGEDWPIGQAVASVSLGYGDSTLARFRESLDALIEVL